MALESALEGALGESARYVGALAGLDGGWYGICIASGLEFADERHVRKTK